MPCFFLPLWLVIQFIDPSYNFLYLYCDFTVRLFYLGCAAAFDFADSPVMLHIVGRYIHTDLKEFGIISFVGVESNLPIVDILSANACIPTTPARSGV